MRLLLVFVAGVDVVCVIASVSDVAAAAATVGGSIPAAVSAIGVGGLTMVGGGAVVAACVCDAEVIKLHLHCISFYCCYYFTGGGTHAVALPSLLLVLKPIDFLMFLAQTNLTFWLPVLYSDLPCLQFGLKAYFYSTETLLFMT